GDRERSPLSEMPDRDQGEGDLVLFALLCLAAVRAGALDQPALLRLDEAVGGLQLLAERDDLAELDGDDVVPRMAAVWARYGPADRPFCPAWVAVLGSDGRSPGDAI